MLHSEDDKFIVQFNWVCHFFLDDYTRWLVGSTQWVVLTEYTFVSPIQ